MFHDSNAKIKLLSCFQNPVHVCAKAKLDFKCYCVMSKNHYSCTLIHENSRNHSNRLKSQNVFCACFNHSVHVIQSMHFFTNLTMKKTKSMKHMPMKKFL